MASKKTRKKAPKRRPVRTKKKACSRDPQAVTAPTQAPPAAATIGHRPTDFNEEIAAAICERLADGDSLRTICRDAAMPARSTVFLWLIKHESFSDQYARAREAQADVLADEIVEIADDGTNDWMEQHGRNGEVIGIVPDHEHIQRSRLRVDARKWIAAKLKPKKYGERVVNELTGKDGAPIEVKNVSTASDADLEAIVARGRGAGAAGPAQGA